MTIRKLRGFRLGLSDFGLGGGASEGGYGFPGFCSGGLWRAGELGVSFDLSLGLLVGGQGGCVVPGFVGLWRLSGVLALWGPGVWPCGVSGLSPTEPKAQSPGRAQARAATRPRRRGQS